LCRWDGDVIEIQRFELVCMEMDVQKIPW